MALKLGELAVIFKGDDTHLDKTMKGVRGKLEAVGGRAREYAPVVGAAMAAGIGAGLLGGLDLQAARAKLTAQVGDPVLAQQLGEAAGRVYGRGFGQSAADAMTAARSVMQAGLLPKNADAAVIEDLTVKAQTLATTFDLDVTQAARAAGQMVRTGLARNATEAFDVLTRGMQVTGDQAGDLLDTFTEYSTQFREVGISGPKAMGMLAQAAKAGARDLDTAADAIKEFAIRSQDGTKQSADAFKALNLDAKAMTATFAKGGPEADKAMKLVIDRLKAMKDPVEKRAAAVALFGAKAEDLGDALYALDPSAAVAGMGNLAGATDRAGKALEQTASQRLESFKRKAQQALVEKLGQAIPTLERVGTWASENSGTLLTVAGVLAGLAVTVWSVNAAMAAWNAVQLISTGITKGAAAAQWLFNAAMYANPVGLVILAVLALVAGIYLLWTNSEAFRKFFIGLWEHVSGFVVAVFQKWWAVFSGFWGAVLSGIASAGRWIRDKVGDLVGWFTGLPGRLRRGLANVASVVSAPFRAGFNAVARAWNNTVGRLSWSVPGWVPGIGGNSISAPRLPMLAKGGHILGAGMAIVGEAGPELVHLGRGATVQPLTGGTAAGGGGGRAEVRLTGELVARGKDLVVVLRENIAGLGGDVQRVIGSNT
ncbi:phage tail tape measure protein [Micromonospora sp. Mcm103]|uniref:phage tail tape measure protein n=1 Tax=Micromonospora sp. Mcm103 TaxID=2926015 RepID=UPI0021C99925|nr:phage tail tape measure protein [Micromonospora sp. Mcm103]